MSGEGIVFAVAVANQLASSVAFLVAYLRAGWPRSAVGRHLVWWVAMSGAIDACWLAVLFARWHWLLYPLLGVLGLAGLLGWYRVWLVWRVRHSGDPARPSRRRAVNR